MPITATPTATPTPTAVPGYKDILVYIYSWQDPNPEDKPLANAKVIYRDANGVEKIAYTGSDGYTKFYNLYGPVMFTLDVVKAGYTFPHVSSEPRTSITHSVNGAPVGYQLKALVTDANNIPLSTARVDAGSLGTFLTDSAGRVSIPVVYDQEYSLTITKPGYEVIRGVLGGKISGNVERRVIAIPNNN